MRVFLFQIVNHSNDKFEFPASVPEDAQDLIRRLLIQEPEERIGASQDEVGYAELKVRMEINAVILIYGLELIVCSLRLLPVEPPVLQWSRVGFAGGADCAVLPAAP